MRLKISIFIKCCLKWIYKKQAQLHLWCKFLVNKWFLRWALNIPLALSSKSCPSAKLTMLSMLSRPPTKHLVLPAEIHSIAFLTALAKILYPSELEFRLCSSSCTVNTKQQQQQTLMGSDTFNFLLIPIWLLGDFSSDQVGCCTTGTSQGGSKRTLC